MHTSSRQCLSKNKWWRFCEWFLEKIGLMKKIRKTLLKCFPLKLRRIILMLGGLVIIASEITSIVVFLDQKDQRLDVKIILYSCAHIFERGRMQKKKFYCTLSKQTSRNERSKPSMCVLCLILFITNRVWLLSISIYYIMMLTCSPNDLIFTFFLWQHNISEASYSDMMDDCQIQGCVVLFCFCNLFYLCFKSENRKSMEFNLSSYMMRTLLSMRSEN